MLKALPDAWPEGSAKGLLARGGFEVKDLEWKDGKISRLVIESRLGGICRIRSYSRLNTEGNPSLDAAVGANPNPFYQIPQIKKPLVSPKAQLKPFELKKTYLYDVKTRPGAEYTFLKE